MKMEYADDKGITLSEHVEDGAIDTAGAPDSLERIRASDDVLLRLKDLSTRIAEITLQMEELGGKVAKRDRVASIVDELRELPRLFSGADALSIDEAGWESVLEGGSVIGAYVRSEHRRRLAAEANREGLAASSGEVSGGTGAIYSVDEIRSMDRSAVRQNLDKVLSSLEAMKG